MQNRSIEGARGMNFGSIEEAHLLTGHAEWVHGLLDQHQVIVLAPPIRGMTRTRINSPLGSFTVKATPDKIVDVADNLGPRIGAWRSARKLGRHIPTNGDSSTIDELLRDLGPYLGYIPDTRPEAALYGLNQLGDYAQAHLLEKLSTDIIYPFVYKDTLPLEQVTPFVSVFQGILNQLRNIRMDKIKADPSGIVAQTQQVFQEIWEGRTSITPGLVIIQNGNLVDVYDTRRTPSVELPYPNGEWADEMKDLIQRLSAEQITCLQVLSALGRLPYFHPIQKVILPHLRDNLSTPPKCPLTTSSHIEIQKGQFTPKRATLDIPPQWSEVSLRVPVPEGMIGPEEFKRRLETKDEASLSETGKRATTRVVVNELTGKPELQELNDFGMVVSTQEMITSFPSPQSKKGNTEIPPTWQEVSLMQPVTPGQIGPEEFKRRLEIPQNPIEKKHKNIMRVVVNDLTGKPELQELNDFGIVVNTQQPSASLISLPKENKKANNIPPGWSEVSLMQPVTQGMIGPEEFKERLQDRIN